MNRKNKLIILISTILSVFSLLLLYFCRFNKKKIEIKKRISLRRTNEICWELCTNDNFEYDDEDLQELKFVVKNYELEELCVRFKKSYLYNRFNSVKASNFSPIVIDEEMNKKVFSYLKGNNLWKIDMSEERDLVKENYTIEMKNAQETEVSQFLLSKTLPSEIEDILSSANFRYKVIFPINGRNVVNRGTYELLKTLFHNDFAKKILSLFQVKELKDVKFTKTEMFFFKEYTSSSFDFMTGLQITDPVFWSNENLFINFSDFDNVSFYRFELNIYEVVFLRNITLALDDQYLTDIIDYLETYMGIKIPDIFIDKITYKVMKKPVLLVEGENFYVDESTIRKHIKEWNEKSPFTRSRIRQSIIDEYNNPSESQNETTSMENTNDRNVANIEADEVTDKSLIIISEIENFIQRLPEKFRKFYRKYIEYEEYRSYPLGNFTPEGISHLE